MVAYFVAIREIDQRSRLNNANQRHKFLIDLLDRDLPLGFNWRNT